GFLAYPVSQAADITAFDANLVPVGEDQLPVIELTRDIVRKFNQLYGNTLVLPEAKLSTTPRLPGVDGKEKMSKSLANTINLSDDSETVRKKVMKMYTDPTRVRATDPGHLEGNVVFMYLDVFDSNKKELNDLKKKYQKGGVGDVEVKNRLTNILNDLLEPMRERRAKYAKDKKKVMKILETGTKKARRVAQETLTRVQKAIGNRYF
ncbi:MAG: tryptophan--tRNA ligase, partial [Anaplasmataceae bacterium]|nr:tryptophan--tRNA ligase [Anaplasmataceae bacterium]